MSGGGEVEATSRSSDSQASAAVKNKKAEDFKFGREIGHGSFSTVHLALEIESKQEVAIKVIEKSSVIRHHSTRNAIWMERYVLQTCDHPLVGRLIASFHDTRRLYFVLPLAPHGELLRWLHRSPNGRFDLDTARFYASELLLALEYLHTQQIVHRDVKPENMLLGPRLHLLLVDFGSAIALNRPDLKAVSFTGTAQFVSPEMLGGLRSVIASASASTLPSRPSSAASEAPSPQLTYLMDFWAFGCVLFQLISGEMPFRSEKAGHSDIQDFELFHKVLNLDYSFPEDFASAEAKDLVRRLLVAEPAQRLGAPEDGGHAALKRHAFFTGVDWSDEAALLERSPPTSFAALVRDAKGRRNNLAEAATSSSSSNSLGGSQKAGGRNPAWANIPNGFNAGQRYQWEQEVISAERAQPVEVVRLEEPLVEIEGGGLVLYMVQHGICLSTNNDFTFPQRDHYLARQRAANPYDQFTQGHLILDFGILYKRRKLRARKRMFIMVEDIRLLYVDPDAMEQKGIVRLSALSSFEVRNSKTFVIRTPGRDYILEDPAEQAHCWVERVRRYWSLFFRSPS